MTHAQFALALQVLAAASVSQAQPADRAIPVPMAQMRANSDVMSLQLQRTGDTFSLADTIAPAQFAGRQVAYYINGQYLGPTLEGFRPLPGTRLGIAKLVLNPNEAPTHFWEIKPERKAQALVAIPDAEAAAFRRQNPTRKYLPTWFEDKTEFRATKFAPKYLLIENKLNAGLLKRSDVTADEAIGRGGMTHVSAEHVDGITGPFDPRQSIRYTLESTHVFDWTGKTDGKTFTRDEIRKVAEHFGAFGLLGDQFGEGNASFQLDSDQEFWFYERAREVANNPRVTWPTIFYGTYGSFGFYITRAWHGDGGVQISPSSERFRKFYDNPALAAQSCSYFERLYALIDANVSWYAQDFGYAPDFYRRAHSIQVMKLGQAQKVAANTPRAAKAPPPRTYLFWWNGIESTDNGHIHNGYQWEHTTQNPPGIARYEEHPSLDLNAALGMCLIGGFVLGDGVIGWDNNIRFSTDPETVGRDQDWKASGPAANPKRAERFGFPAHPVSVMSAQFIASEWYQTCARTSGAPWRYVRYRVDGGAWVEPEAGDAIKSGATILLRASESDRSRQGVALARQKGAAVDWVFHNPMWRPDEEHSVTVEAGGKAWTQRVRGNEVVLCNETA